MNIPDKDYHQQKVTGGEQKVILDEKETAETDEHNSKFEQGEPDARPVSENKPEPGDDPKTELI